ncbi:hypothetical protein K435DRAFT_725281 [Dendrothele bispora CBS 962.96]|uniref:BZIP domain-containing protein n=1 Tax=Dendrothele bispora (strain CBS 962.96) TaxID=1314807 RepID=A0A4S8LW57_DENBC|nr:hypothetical protein K435DRAFT_725281 [Dendrothele bispora CBS 962.96]
MGPRCWQDIYFRHLSSHGHGYALLNPEPNRIGGTEAELELEQLYEEGLRVGDVGITSDSGDFVALFNIFQTSEAPINRVYGVPDGFQPLEFRRNLLFSNAMYHPTNTRVCSEKAHEVKLNADGTALALGAFGPGLGVEIQFSHSHGSILSLPEGAHRVDYRRLPSVRDYAAKNAESWYRFLTDEVGMDAYNGSLYVITGYDRASRYENLSFQSSSKTASLSARVSFLPIGGDIGKLGLSYGSVSSSEHRVGASSLNHTLNNLSPFIRGFKIMLQTGLTKLKAPIKIVDIAKADSKDVLFQGSLPSRPKSSRQTPTSSPSSSENGSSSGTSQLSLFTELKSITSLDSSDSASSFSERGSSILDSDSEGSVNWPYHPLDVINEHILKMCPDAHVAISHDQDWTSVVLELNDKLSDDSTLMGLMTEKYTTCCNEGYAYLMEKHYEQSQTGHPFLIGTESPINKDEVAPESGGAQRLESLKRINKDEVAPESGGAQRLEQLKRRFSPDHLIGMDETTQPRRYLTPSATSRKDIPSIYLKPRRDGGTSPPQSDEEDDELTDDRPPANATDQEKIEWKRRQNTLAARRSRRKKLMYTQQLEETVERLRMEREMWRTRALTLKELLSSHGLPVPDFKD